eukprot:gene3297-biopygen11956
MPHNTPAAVAFSNVGCDLMELRDSLALRESLGVCRGVVREEGFRGTFPERVEELFDILLALELFRV